MRKEFRQHAIFMADLTVKKKYDLVKKFRAAISHIYIF